MKTIGNYERMLADDPNIIDKLKAEAKVLTVEKRTSQKPLTVELASQEITTPDDVTASYRFGHALYFRGLWKNRTS